MSQYLILKAAIPLEKLDALLFTQLLRRDKLSRLSDNYQPRTLYLKKGLSEIGYVEAYCSRTPPFTKANIVEITHSIGSDKNLIKNFKANYQGFISDEHIASLKSVVHAKHSLEQISVMKKAINKLFLEWNHTTGTRIRTGDNAEVEKLEAYISQRESDLKLVIESGSNIVKRNF